jgi:hypothetical protein
VFRKSRRFQTGLGQSTLQGQCNLFGQLFETDLTGLKSHGLDALKRILNGLPRLDPYDNAQSQRGWLGQADQAGFGTNRPDGIRNACATGSLDKSTTIELGILVEHCTHSR